jgi:threonine/homoserine/homoserine lactone efflux protein
MPGRSRPNCRRRSSSRRVVGHWLAFAAASALLLLIPGPTVLMVIAQALAHGRRAAATIVAGVVLGDCIAMTASLAGLGAALAASAALFTALRWAGAAYLVWLGVALWRAPAALPDPVAEPDQRPGRLLLRAFTVTVLNPKSIVFFVAFVPQFLLRTTPLLPQFLLFESTFLALAALNALIYARAAAAAARAIARPRFRRALNRAGGALLIGAGALAGGTRV